MSSPGLPLPEADTALIEGGYTPLASIYDEMMASDGTIRPHWRAFVGGIDRLSSADRAARGRTAQRMLHENGLTYSADADADRIDRPWELDFLPLIVPAAEWQMLEEGLTQRARLLNAILCDLYGPQRLLKDGRLPPALVFASPSFLRACADIEPRDGIMLSTYAADLGRGPDGRWWILADRTEAPAGAGYALENRIITSRCLPELFRECNVQRLAGFFQAMQEGLLSRTGRDDPRIVLLTPGPASEDYFTNAYLARYLGYPLAEGVDLTVRNDRLHMKTVDGLKSVDLIIRCVESEMCDPLDLRADSPSGVAGLTMAARGGSVVVANTLGSGVVQTAALAGFLPGLARTLLGEELKIPSVATWWCGEVAALSHVLDNIETLTVEPAFARRRLLSAQQGPIRPDELSEPERAALVEALRARPHDYVAREPVVLSTAPAWSDADGLRPQPMTLRVYLAARGDDYVMMPGGLARISSSQDARAASLQRGEVSKDAWVISDQPVSGFSLLPPLLSVLNVKRTGKDLPSNAADNLFWLGRYAERAEDTMRVLRGIVRRLTEDTGVAGDLQAIARLVNALLAKTGAAAVPEGAAESVTKEAVEAALRRLLFDAELPHGVQDTLSSLLRTASLVRDRLSVDAWLTLKRFTMGATRRPTLGVFGLPFDSRRADEELDAGIRMLAAFSGMEMENMTRNHGWRFLDTGRRLERAQHLSELLRNVLTRGQPEEDGSLLLLLEAADSFMTYRSRYRTTPQVPLVIDLLMLDESNPRSVAFQMAAIADHVERLPRDLDRAERSSEERIVLALLTDIRLAQVVVLCQPDTDGRRMHLEAVFDAIDKALPDLSEAISRDYFSHAEVQRPADLLIPSGPPQ